MIASAGSAGFASTGIVTSSNLFNVCAEMQAKDRYYACADSQGDETSAKACRQQRAEFELACKASWVEHLLKLLNNKYVCELPLSLARLSWLFQVPCKAHWVHRELKMRFLQVKHFDALRDKEARVLRALHGNINQTASKAKGTLAGKAEAGAAE